MKGTAGKKYPSWPYTVAMYEAIAIFQDWFTADQLLWEAVKCIIRAGNNENIPANLKRAVGYLNRRIEQEQPAVPEVPKKRRT